MTFLKYLLPLTLAVSFTATSAFAYDKQDGSHFDEELNESDFDAVRDFVNTKRDIPLDEKTANLKIAGDVRTEWRNMHETGRKGNILGPQRQLRGGYATDYGDYPVSCNDFDIEFNAYFSYTTDRTWAVAQVQYDCSAGVFDNNKECPGQGPLSEQGQRSIRSDGKLSPDPEGWHGSGTCNNVCLKKAYMGYNLFTCEDTRFDVELGRRRLSHVFDSNIQFLSQFDGILFKYSDKFESVDSWYINLAGFVVNQRVNQFAWVVETGFMNICDSGFDLKYSFIDWQKNGRAQCFYKDEDDSVNHDECPPQHWFRNPEAFQFLNSQITLNYHLENTFCVPANLFAAYLYNHGRKRTNYVASDGEIRRSGRLNTAWYVGFVIGKVVKEGDWSFQAQYQYVGALAVPDGDVRGIGRGNVLDESFTSVERGNANFKGWSFEALYALTDNLTINTCLEWSNAAKAYVGGHHHYSKMEVEAIYAF